MRKYKGVLNIGLIVSLFWFIPLSLCAQKAKQTEKPNIIFILADDLGWKDLSCYGSTFYETPNLDRLAEEGMLFTNAYASSNVCSPSRSSIMTGQYPVNTGITDWIMGRQNGKGPMPYDKLLSPSFSFNLDTSQITIAEALKSGGYATFFAGKWHLGNSPEYWPLNQGFDANKGGWAAGNPWSYGMGGYFSPYHNPRLSDGPEGEFLADRLTTETIKFIKTKVKEKQPFFVDLSFYAVHQKIQSKEKYQKKFEKKAKMMGLDTLTTFIKDAPWMQYEAGWKERIVQSNSVYAGLIYSMDENIGRIMQALEQLGISDNTIIVFTSDNGGLSTAEGAPTSNLPLRYGKGWNYEGGIREPLIIKWPGVAKPGTQCDFPVINTDFYPTFLQMAGMYLMPKQHKDGVSMVPLLKGENSIDQPILYWHYPHYSNQGGTPSSALRAGDWKLIQFYGDNHVELYNLATDIEERRDLSKVFPEKTAKLREKLILWEKTNHAKLPSINPYFNPDYRELMDQQGAKRRQYIKEYHLLFGEDVNESIDSADKIKERLNKLTKEKD